MRVEYDDDFGLKRMLRRLALWETARRFDEFAKWRGVDWVRPALQLRQEWREELKEHAPERPSIAARDLAAAMAEMLPRVEGRLFTRLPAPPVAVAPAPDLPDRPDYVPLKERDPALWAKMSAEAGHRPCDGGCGEWLTEWDWGDKCRDCAYLDDIRRVFRIGSDATQEFVPGTIGRGTTGCRE